MDNTIDDVLSDTMLHKDLVLASCWKLSRYFLRLGEKEKAIEIVKRGWKHDNSKFKEDELKCLAKISDGQKAMRHAGAQLPPEMKDYLKLHYERNSHHPEHWEDVSQMPEMDLCEMVCDWHARSVQFGTDLIKFAKVRQEIRFHFPPEMFQKILELCEVLVSEE